MMSTWNISRSTCLEAAPRHAYALSVTLSRDFPRRLSRNAVKQTRLSIFLIALFGCGQSLTHGPQGGPNPSGGQPTSTKKRPMELGPTKTRADAAVFSQE